MDKVLSVAVVAAYVVVLTFVAVRARAAREFSEFSLAKRALPLALVFGSLAATYVGPGFSIGFVGRGFKSGFLFLGIGLAYSIQNILVGLFVAPRLRALKNCHTLGDAIGQKYDRKCQIVAGIISVSVCTFLAAVMAHAGGVVLNNIFGFPNWSSIAIVIGVTALYTTFGGLRASVITDAFQFTAFATLLPITLLLALAFHLNGGAAAFFKQASVATTTGLNSTSLIEIVGLVAAFLLGETLIPPYANRALASRTTRISRNGFILAGLFSVVWFMVMIALGIVARSIIPEGTSEDHVLLNLFKLIMPAGGYVLLLVVLVSVVMSSLDSLLNAGAVAFTQDIIKPFAKLPDKTSLNIGRCATIVIAAVAAACAPAVPSIIDGLLICYTIWASAILPVLIIGLWIKHPRPLAGILSMGVGTLVAMIAIMCLFILPSIIKVPAIIIPALASALVAYFLGHWIESIKSGA
ncbi:MAG: sodium:solute symporter family protein [Planctomycetota bacterium]